MKKSIAATRAIERSRPVIWPRFDPVRGLYLCESCWNTGDWKHHCALGHCECSRCNGKRPKKAKFTGEGQLDINVTDVLVITSRS